MGAGREHGAERDTGRAQFDGVVEPVDDPAHPVLVGGGRRVGREGADEAKRVDLPPDRVLDPARFTHDRWNFASYSAFMAPVNCGAGPSTLTPGATVPIGSD